jgi:hypothetical protein
MEEMLENVAGTRQVNTIVLIITRQNSVMILPFYNVLLFTPGI